MSTEECSKITDSLQELLEQSRWTLGRETKFMQRKSKLTAGIFVKTLVLGLLEKGNSALTELVQVTKRFGVEISESGLAQRMKSAGVALLKGLVQTAIQQLGDQVTRDEHRG